MTGPLGAIGMRCDWTLRCLALGVRPMWAPTEAGPVTIDVCDEHVPVALACGYRYGRPS